MAGGTEVSNPGPSSEESGANSCRPPCKGASHFGAAHPEGSFNIPEIEFGGDRLPFPSLAPLPCSPPLLLVSGSSVVEHLDERGRSGERPANSSARIPARRRTVTTFGRSQVVRQRILVPPYGGSNPPAPAKQNIIIFSISYMITAVPIGTFGWYI